MMETIYTAQGEPIITTTDYYVKGIAHRGFSSIAPENTLPAYILAKKKGFRFVETDVSFTSDGVAVCLHDATIDRTSNGTGNISSMTWAQVQQYDFGSWKSAEYAGTKIPSLSQFLDLCRDIELHPYIELKYTANYTELQVQGLVAIVASKGMAGKVTWISFDETYLGYVKAADPTARLGFISRSTTASDINKAVALKTTSNEVFFDTEQTSLSAVSAVKAGGLPMEVWTIDSEASIIALDSYITGVTSNSLVASKVLYDNAMS